MHETSGETHSRVDAGHDVLLRQGRARRVEELRPVVRLLTALGALAAAGIVAACGAVSAGSRSDAFDAADLPAIRGQAATCAGPREKAFTLEVRDVTLDLGMGVRFDAWTYDGTLPGPTLEVCEGDTVTIAVANRASVSHGLDSHALRIDMRRFDPVAPGKTTVIDSVVDTPGVYMYHCASGPVTDVHIKNGLYGAMIVYPRDEVLRPARELVVVQSAIFGALDESRLIRGTDPDRARRNDPALVLFNGRLEHTPLDVRPGDLVRAYVVNVGPGVSGIHVMGTILDTVYDGASRVRDVQTYGVAPGSGAIVEFRIPGPGAYGLVDHDRLAYLPWGMAIPFDATGASGDGESHGPAMHHR